MEWRPAVLSIIGVRRVGDGEEDWMAGFQHIVVRYCCDLSDAQPDKVIVIDGNVGIAREGIGRTCCEGDLQHLLNWPLQYCDGFLYTFRLSFVDFIQELMWGIKRVQTLVINLLSSTDPC